MAKKSINSTAASHAVYRGQDVKLFAADLSNYAELRRGLSPAMRAQTLAKKELRAARPDMVISYINSLNQWRQSPQRQKIVKGQDNEVTRLENIFAQVLKTNLFGGNDKVAIAAANLKMKSMSTADARTEIREALNAVDRMHMSDWYKPQDYWTSDYYMQNEKWDPAQASDSMLRLALEFDLVGYYPQYEDATYEEYRRRLNTELDKTIIASQRTSAELDILATAKLFVYGAN